MTHILTFPAPRRESVRTENGWCTRPWTIGGVLLTLKGGGWFHPVQGLHDFGPGVASFAYDAQQIYADLKDEA